MRPLLILAILLLTGVAFFGASKSIGLESRKLASQQNSEVVVALLAEKALSSSHLEQISTLEANDAEQAAELLAMTQAVADMETTILGAQEQQNTLLQENADLLTQNGNLDAQKTGLEAELTDAQAVIARLTGAAETSQADVLSLANQLNAAQGDLEANAAKIASLQAELSAVGSDADVPYARISALEELLLEKDELLAASNDQLAVLEDSLAAKTQTVAALNGRITVFEEDTAALQAAFTEINSSASTPDVVVEEVIEVVVVPTSQAVLDCNAQTNAVFAEQSISFGEGTDAMTAASVPVLQDLVEVALTCVESDLTVTISAYADADTTDGKALSESRAAAIRNFLGANGIPSIAMDVAGYSETAPLGAGDLMEGQSMAQNIKFDWQTR